MESTYNPTTLTTTDFNDKYWFSPLQRIRVVNPLPDDYPFMVELRHYLIKSGASEWFPGMIANVYLDQMSRIVAQNDENLGFMGDPNLRHIYYDKLIVEIEDMAPQAQQSPQYKVNVPKDEVAPWDSAIGERAREVPAKAPEPYVIPEKPKAKEETKEFEYNGLKFKMVGEGGEKSYFKNDAPIDEATYSKAASML